MMECRICSTIVHPPHRPGYKTLRYVKNNILMSFIASHKGEPQENTSRRQKTVEDFIRPKEGDHMPQHSMVL